MNRQYQELKEKNPNAFVWVDDPGLGLIFSALSGYNEVQAKSDLDRFLEGLEGPKGVHLCAKPDWDFLLKSKIDILSFDSFNCGAVIVNYSSLRDFVEKGGIISWGIVPTYTELLEQETIDSLKGTAWRPFGRTSSERGLIRRNYFVNPFWPRPPAIY